MKSAFIKIFLLLIIGKGLFAQSESRNFRAYGNNLNIPGAFIQSYDDKFVQSTSWVVNFTNSNNKAIVELGLNEEMHIAHTGSFKICAKFDVQLTDVNSVATTLTNQKLEITYNPAELTRYKDKAQLIYPGYYKVKVSNMQLFVCNVGNTCGASPCISNVIIPNDVYIQAEITTGRTYDFNFSSALLATDVFTTALTANNNDLQIYWNFLKGATEYELEYTFVDDYTSAIGGHKTPNSIFYDLDHDATRIVTPFNYFDIPLVYEQGYIIYRIRPIGKSTTGERMEGQWTGAPSNGDVASAIATNFFHQVLTSFSADKFNWSFVKTFAENGKAGAGVNFSDGLNYNRQSIARLNTESKSIAQSILYDHYGRPAINFLPAPVSGKTFNYRFNLNKLNSTTIFDKSVFNTCAVSGPCNNSVLALDPANSTGATNYFSSANFNAGTKKGFQDMLSDAEGLAYTRVKFEPNALNVVKSQSLPGKTHAIGGNKEIKYFYAKPSDVELQRLFGTEVGSSVNYYKNYVLDPNGQMSATYLDMYGRTIATGIVGAIPTNLDQISNTNAPVIITEIMSSAPINHSDANTRCKDMNTTFMVTSAGAQQNFKYETTLGTFIPACDANTCYYCAYDLDITIKDECGVDVFLYNNNLPPFLNTSIGATVTPYTNACSPTPPSLYQLTQMPVSITFPHVGTYTVFKKLCVSEAPVAAYKDLFKDNTKCVKPICDVVDSLLAATDFNACLPQTCATCMAQVTAQYSSGGGFPRATPQQISQAYENCAALCLPNTQCGKYSKALEADFYPNTGQLAATTNANANLWAYSVFNPANVLATGPATGLGNTWFTPPASGLPYVNANNSADFVQINSVNIPPQSLTQAQYISNFKKSWAKTLLPLHPEYCKLKFYCDVIGTSMSYDESMANALHFDIVCASLGYSKPLTISSIYAPAASCVSSADPILTLGSTYPSLQPFITTFVNEMTSNVAGSGMDIYQYVANIIYNGSIPVGHKLGSDPCTADLEWQKFASVYKYNKFVLYQNMQTYYLANLSSFGFVGGCSSFPAGQGFTSNFPNIQDSIVKYLGVTINPNTQITNSSNATTIGNNILSYINSPSNTNNINNQCQTNCGSYTALWINNLTTACPAYVAANATTQNNIIAALTGVCMSGCNAQNPMGASTSSPTGGYTIPSTAIVVTTFQQVLNHYLGTNVCNANILSQPLPYSATQASSNSLSSCKCDQLLQIKKDFIIKQTNATLPPGVSYIWQYYNYVNGYDLKDISLYICACETVIGGANIWYPGYPWSGTQQTQFTAANFAVSPKLECSSCITCNAVSIAIDALIPNLPAATPFTDPLDKITLNAANSLYAMSILNQQFGQHTTLFYENLYNDCRSYTATPTALTFSNNVSTQAIDLYKYLHDLAHTKNLVKPTVPSRPMKLCTDSKYFLSSLYSGVLPSVPNYLYTTSLSGPNLTVLTINIFDAFSVNVLSLQLALPPAYTAGWTNIKSFSNFMAYCPTPVAGNVYSFKVTAGDYNFSSQIVTGSILNSAFPIAQLSNSSTPMPTYCPPKPAKPVNTCLNTLINNALSQANLIHDAYMQSLLAQFEDQFLDHCYNTMNETFERNYNIGNESNHTLYYYDQAGNLQRTVPPNGVSYVNTLIPLTMPTYPAHSAPTAVNLQYVSDYQYNSYNAPVTEKTVDGGLTTYFYDLVGRIIASQNAKQAAANPKKYSYTLYDNIGRTIEAGEFQKGVSQPDLTELDTENPSLFSSYLALTTRRQVTQMFYDSPTTITDVLGAFDGNTQDNLRNRVSYVTYKTLYTSSTVDYGTFYSYDTHGNVKELVQYNPALSPFSTTTDKQTVKHVNYEYDLVSGNMNKATYQKNKVDVFIHKYYYDDDNRIHEVFTSKDELNWDRDAKYFYYEHGPLARVERADKQVQGTDHFYTIHGWIKGLNSDALKMDNDAGKDGAAGNNYLTSYAGIHNYFAQDAMAFSLNYYNTTTDKDYIAINNGAYNGTTYQNPLSDKSLLNTAQLNLAVDGPSLYNGNISSMVTTFIDKDITNLQTHNAPNPQLTAYRYDQLHRIKQMKAYRNLTNNAWVQPTAGNTDDSYKMTFSYDANGNLLTLTRNGSGPSIKTAGQLLMDNLSYKYFTQANGFNNNSNQLACLTDQVASANYDVDVDAATTFAGCAIGMDVPGNPYQSASTTRFKYDEIGSLISDKGEYIAGIEWTVDRKVKKITRDAAAMLATGTGPTSVTKPDIEYEYNAMRQRVTKIVKPRNQTTKQLLTFPYWTYTHYIYDAGGNVLAVYDRSSPVVNNVMQDKLTLSEHHLYGNKRLALTRTANEVSWNYNFTPCGTSGEDPEASPCRTALSEVVVSVPQPPAPTGTYSAARYLGYKEFELNNHLDNVIATVSDRKLQATLNAASCVNNFDMNSGIPTNIVPQNMGLTTSAGSLQCTIQTSGISGIDCKFGTNISAGSYLIEYDWDPGTLTASDGVFIQPFDYNGTHYFGSYFCDGTFVPPAGHYSFIYTPTFVGAAFSTYVAFYTFNPVSNNSFKIDNLSMCPVNAPVTVSTYTADLLMHTDYYAYGQQMPGRTWVASDYRYGMNGQEHEDEITAGHYSAEFWEYDSRLGRRWNTDPIVYPFESPYACFHNNPIYWSDPSGAEGEDPIKKGQTVDLGNGQSFTSSFDEVEVTATRGGSESWNNFASSIDMQSARNNYSQTRLNEERNSWYYKGRYGTDNYGQAAIPSEVQAGMLNQYNNEFIPALKEYWAQSNSGGGMAYYYWKALTVTTKAEGERLVNEVALTVTTQWLLQVMPEIVELGMMTKTEKVVIQNPANLIGGEIPAIEVQLVQTVPNEALNTLSIVESTGAAPSGYVGGRTFLNKEGLLPSTTANGASITYKEWDILPKVNGVNRGAQRIVTGSNGSAYYTADHYRSFTQIK